ncbi:MAG: glycoside hydrolase family 16 protein [Gammaproteobacteria bacterium]|nr:glycoside hydrolase family 16 protein [Gammaproteobacteria bacterium]
MACIPKKRFGCSPIPTLAMASLASALIGGCSGGNTDSAQGGNQPTTILTPKGWELVWADEFDGSSLDTVHWNIQTGDGSAEGIPGWGNNELQSYQAENVSVSGGNLVITARQDGAADGRAYTSGRINTAGNLDITYGRVEANIHAPAGQGLWSAFWMLPTNSAYGTWAAGGEIDIMEVFSRDPTPFTQAALHYGMAWPLNTFIYAKYEGIDPADGFHVYAVEWDEQELRWFVDGTHYYTVRRSTYWNHYKDASTNAHVSGGDSAPFDRPFHLLLNLAVGGNLPGAPVPGALPGELRVDYVRVYECNLNTATGVGCDGFADYTSPTVTPPLPDDVYRAVYELYVDAVGPLLFPDTEDAVTLDFGVYDAGGALVLSEVDTGGDRGMVIDVSTSGGGNFSIYPASLERQTLFGMGNASDPGSYAGELQFDLYVFGDETDTDSSLQVKIDSGFPDLGFVDLPFSTLTKDEWTTVTVQISDIAHNPGHFGGGPVDLGQVLSLFVLEPTSSAHLQVDNIRLICAHVRPGDCGITPPAPPPPPTGEPQPVYIDAVDPIWDVGINGADSGSGWANYADGTNPANKVQWNEVEADDPARGEILEVTFSGSEAFGVWFIQSSMGIDLSAYAPGVVSFDIKVDDYGANEDGMTMKIDCVFPCTSGDQRIGKVGDGAWETVEIPVAQLLGGGLNLSTVNTGIVVFPTVQSSELTFQLDNVQWLPGDAPGAAGAVVLYDEAVAEGWFLWDCCGGATFGEVADDADHGNVVELAFGATGTVTGFQAIEGVDVSALASGTLEFDFKEVSPPPEGSVWRLKLESSNAATFVEVLLTAADNPAPGADWQHYGFGLSTDLAGLDLSDVKLVMIFPDWANADGAVGRIDNVRFVPAGGPVELYADVLAEGWFLWDCCGAATFAEVTDDEDHGNVIELSFRAGGTVTGLQATAGVDASATAGGTLEFDFKEVSPPPDGSQWHVKLESSGAATAVDILMTAGGNPAPTDDWQAYSFDLDAEFAALDLSDLKLVLFFPDWENANGAVARIDNVRLVPAQ